MSTPQPYAPDPSKGVLIVDWPLFGELARALAVRVAREWTPDLVIGVATAGVVPGAAVAAILDCPFHSILISRRYSADQVRRRPRCLARRKCAANGCWWSTRPAIPADAPAAVGAVVNAGPRSAFGGELRTGAYAPDYHALATQAMIVLPWDREILVDGELRPNPKYAGLLPQPVV